MAYVVFLSLLKQLCFPKDHSESSSRTGLEIKEGHILPIFGSVLGAQQNGILIKATTDFNKKKKKNAPSNKIIPSKHQFTLIFCLALVPFEMHILCPKC